MGWNSQNFTTLLIITATGGFSGLFVYSPSPGNGNLIASIAGSAGTDPFGNSYVQGIASYGPGPAGGTTSEIVMADIAGVLTQTFKSGAASERSPMNFSNTVTSPNTANEQVQFVMLGPQNTTNIDQLELAFFDSTAASPLIAAAVLNYIDTILSPHALLIGSAVGLQLPLTVSVNGAQPGTVGTTLAGETWHNISPGAFFAAGSPGPRYRFEPIGTAGQVRLSGFISLTANLAANTTFFTLPAGYHPAVAQSLVGPNNLSGFALLNSSVAINTSGQMQIAVAGSNGNVFGLDGMTFPLD